MAILTMALPTHPPTHPLTHLPPAHPSTYSLTYLPTHVQGNINLEVIKGGAMGENPVHRQIRSESNLRLGSVSVDSAASDPGYSRVDPSYIRDAVVGRSATMSNDAWGKSVSQPPPAKRSSVETGATRRRNIQHA